MSSQSEHRLASSQKCQDGDGTASLLLLLWGTVRKGVLRGGDKQTCSGVSLPRGTNLRAWHSRYVASNCYERAGLPCHAISDNTHLHIGSASQPLKYISNGFTLHTQLHIYHNISSTNITAETYFLHSNLGTNVHYRRNYAMIFIRLFHDLTDTIQPFIQEGKKNSVKPDV